MQRIPPAPVQDVMAAATLARLRHDAEMATEDQLRILADAGENCFKREEEVWNWNRRHGNGR
jgi:hypothetical protein